MKRIDLVGYVRRHHVGLLALVFALGGTSYAAVRLPSHSVGTVQLRNGAVIQTKLSANAVSSPQVNPLAAGPRLQARSAAAGVRGPNGDLGSAGPQGASGPQGRVGPSGPKDDSFDTRLPSGKTLRGAYGLAGRPRPKVVSSPRSPRPTRRNLLRLPELLMIADRAAPTS